MSVLRSLLHIFVRVMVLLAILFASIELNGPEESGRAFIYSEF